MGDSRPQPGAEVTLARAEDSDKKIWVYETHDEVVGVVNEAKRTGLALVTFNRVEGIGNPGKSFSTTPGNVQNVRDISERSSD